MKKPGFFDRAMQMLSTGYKWLDSADKAIKGVFQDIGEIAGTWLQGLGCMALEGIEALGEGIAGLWNGAKDVVGNLWRSITPAFLQVSTPQSMDEMMKDKSMQRFYVEMHYNDKEFMTNAREYGIDEKLIELGEYMYKKEE